MKFATENTFWDKYDTDRISVDMKRKCQSTLSVKLNIFPFYHVCCLGAQPLVKVGTAVIEIWRVLKTTVLF